MCSLVLKCVNENKYKKEKFMGMQSVCKYFEGNPEEFDLLQKDVLSATN